MVVPPRWAFPVPKPSGLLIALSTLRAGKSTFKNRETILPQAAILLVRLFSSWCPVSSLQSASIVVTKREKRAKYEEEISHLRGEVNTFSNYFSLQFFPIPSLFHYCIDVLQLEYLLFPK